MVSTPDVRVLVVDDEATMRDLLTTVLSAEGWLVHSAATGASALQEARTFKPHVIVLDIVLPDIDGIEVLKILRGEGIESMVLFLTANAAVYQRVEGIRAGGDDYVTKPFSIAEVTARLHGLLRRSPTFAPAVLPLSVGDLVLNETTHEVSRAGIPINLTPTEFSLLSFLMKSSPRPRTRAEILQAVWGYDFGADSNVVELYISYLRKKIDADRSPLIHTVRSVGYVLRQDS